MKTNMIKKIVATGIIVLLTSTDVFGDSLQIPLFSDHRADANLNEINPGLIYEYDLTDIDTEIGVINISAVGGGYKNSYKKLTAIVGGEVQYKFVGVQAGIATGYKQRTGQNLSPMLSLFAEAPVTDSFSVRGSYIPSKHGVFVFSIVVDY